MRLTTKGRYAVTAMLDLALHVDRGPISLADISERQGISLSYLEQLFTKLRRKELVKSTRGPGGGYSLSRDAHNIAIAEIITAVDEKMDTTRCGGLANCQGDDRCLTHELWASLSDQIYSFLSGISLGNLTDQEDVQEVALRQSRLCDEKELSENEANVTLDKTANSTAVN